MLSYSSLEAAARSGALKPERRFTGNRVNAAVFSPGRQGAMMKLRWEAQQNTSSPAHCMLTLYYAPNTCALASHIALEEVGADYTLQRLDFDKEEQRADAYVAINPKARVPTLVTERGVLTETPAILAFIAQSFPAARLAPFDDTFAFANVQAFNSYICSTVHVAHAHRRRGYRWADDAEAIKAMQRKVPESVGNAFAVIEHNLLKGPWVMGERYTICDPYLFTLAQWLEADGAPIDRLPRVLEHRQRMSQRAAVRKAIAAEFDRL
jgi:glutathione S-transferase